MTGYTFTLGPMHYIAHRDGTPYRLIDAWREVYGVGGATIYAPNGRVVLRNAGSLAARGNHIRSARTKPARRRRNHARILADLTARSAA
ncbi:hypothetical protein ABN028_19600 [Actinopolymorpha sp. B17G11]|uniref:hypothetical protein n=1 Tax=Actinopolymorpha sp. B17G11 TaxID=3160861 RepID=UPI0032E3F2D3